MSHIKEEEDLVEMSHDAHKRRGASRKHNSCHPLLSEEQENTVTHEDFFWIWALVQIGLWNRSFFEKECVSFWKIDLFGSFFKKRLKEEEDTVACETLFKKRPILFKKRPILYKKRPIQEPYLNEGLISKRKIPSHARFFLKWGPRSNRALR